MKVQIKKSIMIFEQLLINPATVVNKSCFFISALILKILVSNIVPKSQEKKLSDLSGFNLNIKSMVCIDMKDSYGEITDFWHQIMSDNYEN